MIYISIEDFYEKASLCKHLTREEELVCAQKMQAGDNMARELLIQSYIPMVAGYIKHMRPHLQNWGLVVYCVQALEKAVDSFDFMQESEPFCHHLGWRLRQVVASHIVK